MSELNSSMNLYFIWCHEGSLSMKLWAVFLQHWSSQRPTQRIWRIPSANGGNSFKPQDVICVVYNSLRYYGRPDSRESTSDSVVGVRQFASIQYQLVSSKYFSIWRVLHFLLCRLHFVVLAFWMRMLSTFDCLLHTFPIA